MPTPIQKAETREIGKRLRALRMGLAEFKEDYSLKTLRVFAAKTGIDEDNLSNWELGRSMVPYDYTQGLKDQFGISFLFEWIYGGDDGGLPGRLTDAMNPKTPTPQPKPPKSKTRSKPRA